MGKRLLPEQVQKIIELYKKGYQISEIARRLKIHRQTVSKYIRLHNNIISTNTIFEDNKSNYTIERYSVLFNILSRNIDEDWLEDYEKIREFTIYDEKDAKMLKKCGFEVEEKESNFGKYFIVKIPLGLVHLIAEISHRNILDLYPLDDLSRLLDEIKMIGNHKMKRCVHNKNGFCMVWYYVKKPEYGKNGKDYLEINDKYYIKAIDIMCALCPYYKRESEKIHSR